MDEKVWNAHLERSDKNGWHWEKIKVDNDSFGVIQPTLLRYSRRRLQILCRSRHDHIVQAWSVDNGKT